MSSVAAAPREGDRGLLVEDLAGLVLMAGAFTSSWNGLHVGGLQLVDPLLALTLGMLALAALARGRLWPSGVPAWVWFGVGAVIVDVILRQWWPMTASYMTHRVDLSGMHGRPAPSAFTEGIQWLVALFVLPLCVCGVSGARGRWNVRIAMAWACGIALSCVVAATDQIGLTQVSASLIGQDVDYSGRQAGLQAHANSLGVASVLAFPVATWFARRRPVAGIAMQGLLMVGVVLSGSRGAQVALALACVAMAVWAPGTRRGLARLVALGVVASPFLVGMLGGMTAVSQTLLRFGSDAGNADASNAERGQIAVQGLHDFALHPLLGVGLDQITYAHNIYLQMLSAGGLVLLVGMALYFGGAIRGAYKLSKHQDLAFFMLVTIVCWLVLGMVENSLVDRFLYVPLSVVAGLWVRRQGKEMRPRRGFDG